MSDYLTQLAMRAISPVPAVRPLVRTAYESPPMDETVWPAAISLQMTTDDSPPQSVKSSHVSPQVFRKNHPEESPLTAQISESVVQTPIRTGKPVIEISTPEPREMPPHEVLHQIASFDPAESLLQPRPPAARKPSLVIDHQQEKVSQVQPEVLEIAPPIPRPDGVLPASIPYLSPAKEQSTSAKITMSHSSTELILGTGESPKIAQTTPALFPKIPTHALSQFRNETTALRPEKSPTRPVAAPTPPPAPEVKITIGRVEIRATPPAVQAPAVSSSTAPHLSLETYLRRSASRSA